MSEEEREEGLVGGGMKRGFINHPRWLCTSALSQGGISLQGADTGSVKAPCISSPQ